MNPQNQSPTPQSPSEPPIPPVQTEDNNRKLYILFTFLAALVFIVGGYWLWMKGQTNKQTTVVPTQASPSVSPSNQASPASDEFKGWKMYTNEMYDYTFKYKPNPKLKQFSCSKIPLEK